jgi:hypothetical protein
MHTNRRAGIRKTPGCASMIKVNVAQKNVPNILWFEAGPPELGNYVFESRFRPSVEQDDAVVGFQCSHGNDAGATEVMGVKDVDHRAGR